MELHRLGIQNFRQFYGKQEIEFSTDADQNVTVIHGANGSGKTTLLNAFIWLFYEDLVLPQPRQIATERAMAEAEPNSTVTVSVTLEFGHEDYQYEATRKKEFRKHGADDLTGTEVVDDISLEFTDEQGNRKIRNNPENSLKQIMPERLRDIFFFDGETIDELSALGGQERIQNAIRKIMGLEILERGIRHLDTARERFERELQTHGSKELSDLVDRKQELQDKQERKNEELEEIQKSKQLTKDEIEDVDERLSELEGSQKLQEERERLQDELESVEDRISDINRDIADVISESGYLPFATPALERTAEMLRDKRQKGEIPSEIKTHFVDDLLDMEECICGRPLEPGSDAYHSVSGWRQRAGSSNLEEVAMNIAGRLSEMGESEEALYDDIEDHLDRRQSHTDRKQEINERLDEISSQLADEDTEDIAKLEQRRNTLNDELTQYDQEIGRLKGDIDDLEEEIEELQDDIDDAKEENKKADLARRRAQTAAYLRDRIESLFSQYQDEVRQNVNGRVNDIFTDIIEPDYYAQITEDYKLKILKNVDGQKGVEVAKSTGERQVASLSFIATLVSLAKERYESDEDATYFTGGIYPMIMDSPFGSLDPTYQQKVSRMLPEMAHQVTVMVTQSQWSEEVAGEMEKVAGKHYHLEYYDSDDPGVAHEHTKIVPQNEVTTGD
jgi:DNA sulfur modification protein DndD